MKKKAFVVMIGLIMFLQMINISVSAAPRTYVTKKTITKVPINKEWEIKFSSVINKGDLYDIKLYDENEKLLPRSVKYSQKDKKTILLKSLGNLKYGKNYKIIIEGHIKDVDGNELGKGLIIPFKTANIYEGLPYEEGLILVENRAYSIQYLANNASKRNEIIFEDKGILYIYDDEKQWVKDLIGDKLIDGMTIPVRYKQNVPIVYTNEFGEESFYAWDKKLTQFKLVKPTAKVKVTVGTDKQLNKVVVMNVQEVDWLTGAQYYKFEGTNGFKKLNESVAFTSTDASEKFYIYSNAMTKLAEGEVRSFFNGTYNIELNLYEKRSEGNSSGNIINNGYVAADEVGYVYYNNTGDRYRLYKYDTNGIFHGAISDNFGQYINVVGEWIYYSNYSDKGKLYRMKVDGSENVKLNDDYSAFINVVGDYIYYSNHSDNGRICRIRKDGSDFVKDEYGKHGLPISTSEVDESAFLNVVGDWIYYVNVNKHHRIYKVSKDGTIKSQINDEGASSIQAVDEWIYYTNSKGQLKKVTRDGSKVTVDIDAVAAKFDRGYYFNVVDDWIYYANAKDSNRLYKVKTDGSSERIRMTYEPVTHINVVYDTIYFISNKKMFKLSTSSIGKTRPEEIKKVESSNGVVSVEDIEVFIPHDEVNDSLETLEKNHLPPKVPAILEDNTMHQLVVQWDKERVQIKDGVRTYMGKLIGYKKYIKLTMLVPSEMLNETNTIKIFNNAGINTGHIEVTSEPYDPVESNPPKLQIGDIIRMYEDEDLSKVVGQGVVKRDGKLNVASLPTIRMDRYGTVKYYMTIQRKNKTESKPTVFNIGEAPVITNTIHKPVKDLDDEGLGLDGRDFYIEELEVTQNKVAIDSYIYLTPANKVLQMQNDNLIRFDEKPVTGKNWIGRRYQDETVSDSDLKPMNLDSFGDPLTGIYYDLYLITNYVDKGSPDIRGGQPKIIGVSASEGEKITVESEALPYDPALKKETKKYGEIVTLQRAPRDGEFAYLVPVWEEKFDDVEYQKYMSNMWIADGKAWSHKTWLYEAKTWLQENGDWPFKDGHPAVENGWITKLEGDGVSRVMPVPTGFIYSPPSDVEKQSKYYAPNIKYKLVIINEIGVSSVSSGTLTVDNRPPIVVKEFITGEKSKLECGFPLQFQSRYENADVYIVDSLDNLTNVEQLEEAVKVGAAYKFSVLSGVTTQLPTYGIKPDLDKEHMNYRIMVKDKVGNVTEVGTLSIYVDINRLIELAKSAEVAIVGGDILAVDIPALKDVLEEAKGMIEKVQPHTKDIVTQNEINSMVKRFENKMIELGVPFAFHSIDDLGTDNRLIDKIALARNHIRKLRFLDNHGVEIDLNNVDKDVWLPTRVEQAGDFAFEIQWEVSEFGLIENKGSNIGTVKRPIGENPVDRALVLTGKIMKDGYVVSNGTVTYFMTISAKKFDTIVTTPLSNRATIYSKGVHIGGTSDITVEFYDKVTNKYKPLLVYDGITYSASIAQAANGIDWDMIISMNGIDTDLQPGDVFDIRIIIDNVIMTKQVKLRIPEDGFDAIIMKY